MKKTQIQAFFSKSLLGDGSVLTCKYFIKIYSAFKSNFFTESLAIGADINDCVCRLPNHDFPIEDNHSIGRYGWVFDYLPHVHQTSLAFSDFLSAKLRVSFFYCLDFKTNKTLVFDHSKYKKPPLESIYLLFLAERLLPFYTIYICIEFRLRLSILPQIFGMQERSFVLNSLQVRDKNIFSINHIVITVAKIQIVV